MARKKKARVSLLSRLPEHVLDRILCFLPQKEAVRTCVLSKSWRHVGPSRSKLDLNDQDIDQNFMSVMYNTLQRYNHQTLSLKHLSLKSSVKLNLPSLASKAEFLEELHLERCHLSPTNETTSSFNHLRTLSLVEVSATRDALDSCPFLERLCILRPTKLPELSSAPLRLKHFELAHECLSEIELDSSTLETMRLDNCRDHSWFPDSTRFFPSLKRLHLKHVMLSDYMFGFFDSDYMPSLEKLKIEDCFGCRKFRLSSSSIEHLSIDRFTSGNVAGFSAEIDAPNIRVFKLKAYHRLPSISFAPIRNEWKSDLDLRFVVYDYITEFKGIVELDEMLKSLSKSEMSLISLFFCNEAQSRIVDIGFCDQNEPLVVEGLRLGMGHSSYCTVPEMFGYLFRVCRPRYIYDVHIEDMSKDTSEIILRKFLLDERGERDYYWNRDLEEVSMESSYAVNPNKWRSVPGNSLPQCENQRIRYRLKWRGTN